MPSPRLDSHESFSFNAHATLPRSAKCKWKAIKLIGILLLLRERNQANHNIRPQSVLLLFLHSMNGGSCD